MAAVNSGELLLIAQAYFCHCKGLWKGQPEKPASQTFKQVVWRLLDWTPWGQKPILPSFFLTPKCLLSTPLWRGGSGPFNLQPKIFCLLEAVWRSWPFLIPPFWKWLVLITLTLTVFLSHGADSDFVLKIHICICPGMRAMQWLHYCPSEGQRGSLVHEGESIVFCQFLVNLMKVAFYS